jgi:hypothetical protein
VSEHGLENTQGADSAEDWEGGKLFHLKVFPRLVFTGLTHNRPTFLLRCTVTRASRSGLKGRSPLSEGAALE